MPDVPLPPEDESDGPAPLDRWQRVEGVFEQALGRPPAERAAFLDRACADDLALRREVESLLAAYGDASGYFGRLADEVVQPAFQEAGGLEPGTFVGPYQVVRLVGRGGMGEVYEARRGDGAFEQTVALKLVSRAGSAAVLRRFEAERQILASLDHPHIARLLDGGLSGEGRPYFAMEFVRGLPITAYCDRHRLSVDARLQLFRTVCDAVQHAHRRLVVHRDLKPSNILVAETEAGEPVVKLLDFGIAKVLEAEPGVSVLETQTGLRLMTPEYAAPEQVRGEPVTTATDVYALGVLLYELLTGHRPYRLAERLPHEAERVILEEDPVRPSTAVTEAEERPTGTGSTATLSPAAVSAARATEVGRLRRRLAGDLDRICLMALRKEPDRRYGSATDLAEDVRRHLDGLPVAAQPDTVGYRARKFVRRHRAGVGAAVAVLLALVVGLGAALWQAQVAAAERDRAAAEAIKAQEVTDFLMGLFEASDPRNAQGDTVSVRTLLEQGVQRAEDLDSQPEVQARMLEVTGQVYRNLGQYDRARALLDNALTLRQDAAPAERAASLHALAGVLGEQGAYDRADSLFREALALREAYLGPDHPDVAATLNDRAVVLSERSDYDEAEALLRRALAIRRATFGDDHPVVARSLSHLAVVLKRTARYDEAVALYDEALAIRRAALSDRHPDVPETLQNLGTLYLSTGEPKRAEPYLREALALNEAILGRAHPRTVFSIADLAVALKNQERYDEAEPYYWEALRLDRALLGDDHPNVGIDLQNIATMYRDRGDYERADSLYGEALAVFRPALGDAHPQVGIALGNRAATRMYLGDLDAAEALFRESLVTLREALPSDHPYLGVPMNGIGDVLILQGRPQEAEAALRDAVAFRQTALSDTHWVTARTKASLGESLAAQARYEEAEPLLTEAYERIRATPDLPQRHLEGVLEQLVDLYTTWSRPQDAERYRQRLQALRAGR